MLQAIAGPDPRDLASAAGPSRYRAGLASSDLKGARLGIPRSMFERDRPASGPMRGAFDAAVEVLRGLGAAIAEINLTCRSRCRSSAAILTRPRCCALRAGDTLARVSAAAVMRALSRPASSGSDFLCCSAVFPL